MSASEVGARIESGLARVWAQVSAALKTRRKRLPEVSSLSPKARVAGALAGGLVLGKVVRRLGR